MHAHTHTYKLTTTTTFILKQDHNDKMRHSLPHMVLGIARGLLILRAYWPNPLTAHSCSCFSLSDEHLLGPSAFLVLFLDCWGNGVLGKIDQITLHYNLLPLFKKQNWKLLQTMLFYITH